ncbi:MAG: DEAD/DEAH box helicase [Candidatus Hydrogenedens sp.]|nr:DEAD/DEAH box helicase [Candidatus Hydrogenedens sp.]
MPRKDIGEDITRRFTPEAARALQEAIDDAGGHEVFFAGSLNASGIVESVRVCARGHASAVPALFESLQVRDVVIHNHPSGRLDPSDADLQLASMYSTHGHGVYIIDNPAERVYVVVEPFLQSDQQPLHPEKVAGEIEPGGRLSAGLKGYEYREQQRDMAVAVIDALNHDRITVVEAPTGVGKTVAYLLPAIHWAAQNKERVVVSTRTINLQEQIIEKDLPALQRALGTELSACLVKGRGNYLCWRKLNRALGEATLFEGEERREQLNELAAWAERTPDGSRSDLPFVPARDLWSEVCSEADSCGFSRCPDKKRCFVTKARRDIARADIVVVNHHLLFSDIAIKRETGDFSALALLPAYKRLILDEAHSVEDSATEYFGVSATRLGALATLGRLYRTERQRQRGLLPLFKAKLMKDCHDLPITAFEQMQAAMDTRIEPAVADARRQLDDYFDAIRSLGAERCEDIGRDIKWRLTEAALAEQTVRIFHQEVVHPLVECLRTLCTLLLSLAERAGREVKSARDPESPIVGELAELQAYALRLERLAETLAEITSPQLRENTVRWVEFDATDSRLVRVARCPLEVGEPLAEGVYEHLRSVVLTSATLTVNQRFDYLFSRLGMDRLPSERVVSRRLTSPFDYANQAMLAIPNDLPEPTSPDFGEASHEALLELLNATHGGAFVLFTSYAALDRAHRALIGPLNDAGLTVHKQGALPRNVLLERFRADHCGVLFATDSFWEGVDVAGQALRCVVLVRLPFRVPSEPVLEARSEAIEARGGNAFMDYAVPQAAIKFRQGFGRLIRRKSDIGAVVVLDRRIVTKYYGRVFLKSLPELQPVQASMREIAEQVRAFLAQPRGE